MCKAVEIAEAAACAARAREDAMKERETSEKLQEPTVMNLDAFRAKVTARTQKFNKYMDRSKKQRENAGHGLKLAWLRAGQEVEGLGSFQETLRQEASTIEAEDLAAAEA